MLPEFVGLNQTHYMHSQAVSLDFKELFEEKISKIIKESPVALWIFLKNQILIFWGKEDRKIWNMNILQFSTIHHVSNTYNLGFKLI